MEGYLFGYAIKGPMNQISKLEILILDEDQGITELCTQALNGGEGHVFGVNFPEEGLEILRQQPIDVLLVAARMKGMDSRQFIEIARQRRTGLAVVLMAGLGDIEMAVNSLLDRVDGLLIKQFSEEEVVACLQMAIQNRRQKLISLRFQALEPLLGILKNIFMVQDLNALAELSLEASATVFECENVAVYIRQKGDPDQFEVIKTSGKPLPLSEISKIYEPGIINLRDSSPRVAGDVLEKYGLTSLLWSPIRDSESHLGIVIIGRDEKGNDFDSLDLGVENIFNGYIAATIKSLREQIEIKAQREQIQETQDTLKHIKEAGSIGRLMANVAHEINNPLQAVQSNLDLVVRADTPQKREHYITIVKQELSRLRRIVGDMLTFYRPDQKAKTTFSINKLLQHVLDLYAPRISEQNIQVHADFYENLPDMWGWPDRIEQVFINLITNALEAMPQGGELFTSTVLQKNQISIMIKDTGHGIPPGIRNRIFDPFFTTKEKSRGLGLTICDNIITSQHQGKIEIKDTNKAGTCFIFTLPIGG